MPRIAGYGMSADAYHVTAPAEDANGAVRVMQAALDDAGVEPAAVDYVNAHGTSTRYNDKLETLAIKKCFGSHARSLAISSTKSMTGHLLGAAGGLEAGIAALVVRDQVLPPTINLEHPDPDCDPRLRAEVGSGAPPSRMSCPTRSASAARTRACSSGAARTRLLRRLRGEGAPAKRTPGVRGAARSEWKRRRSRRQARTARLGGSGAGLWAPASGRRGFGAQPRLNETMLKIAVCIKQVVTRDWPLRVDDAGTWVRDGDASFEMNEPDAYALEEALRLKEQHGGEVIICAAGPARVGQVIREGLARGADSRHPRRVGRAGSRRGVRVADALADALRPEACDLVLTGLQSDDQGFGQTGVVLAERLGVPHATINHGGGRGRRAVAREARARGAAGFQWVSMPLPALLTIQSGINQLRYATLRGIMAAKKKEVRTVTPGPGATPRQRIARLYVPQKDKRTQLIEGSAGGGGRRAAARVARGRARILKSGVCVAGRRTPRGAHSVPRRERRGRRGPASGRPGFGAAAPSD